MPSSVRPRPAGRGRQSGARPEAAPKDADAGEAGLVTGLELTQKSLLTAFEANNLKRVAPAAGRGLRPAPAPGHDGTAVRYGSGRTGAADACRPATPCSAAPCARPWSWSPPRAPAPQASANAAYAARSGRTAGGPAASFDGKAYALAGRAYFSRASNKRQQLGPAVGGIRRAVAVAVVGVEAVRRIRIDVDAALGLPGPLQGRTHGLDAGQGNAAVLLAIQAQHRGLQVVGQIDRPRLARARPAPAWPSATGPDGRTRPRRRRCAAKRAAACQTTLPPQQKPVMPTLSALAQGCWLTHSRVAEMSPMTCS